MGVKAIASGKEVETAALVSAGFETDAPEVVLPSRLAERLGLWPEPPEGSRAEEYGSVGGIVRLTWIPSCALVHVLAGKGATKPVKADASISEFETEVLLSDKLTGKLGIILEDVGKGRWRLRGERRVRRSEKPRRW